MDQPWGDQGCHSSEKKKPLLIWKMQFYVSLHDLSSICAPSTGRLTGEAHPCPFVLEEQEDPAHEFKHLDVSYLTWWNPWLKGDSMSRCFDTWFCLPSVLGWLGPQILCWEIWHLTSNFLPRPDKGLLLRIISVSAFSLLSREKIICKISYSEFGA